MDCLVHGVAKSQTQLSNFHLSLLSLIFAQTVHTTVFKLEYTHIFL